MDSGGAGVASRTTVSAVPRLHVDHVEISPEVAAKIASKHGVSADDVRAACQAPARYRRAWWTRNADGYSRLVVVGVVRGRVLKIVLQPIDVADGAWRLRTAVVSRTVRGR